MDSLIISATSGFVAPNGHKWSMRGPNAGLQDALGALSISIEPTPGDVLGTVGDTLLLSGQLETKPTFSQGADGLECHRWLHRGAHPLRSRQMASSRN